MWTCTDALRLDDTTSRAAARSQLPADRVEEIRLDDTATRAAARPAARAADREASAIVVYSRTQSTGRYNFQRRAAGFHHGRPDSTPNSISADGCYASTG